MLALPNFSLDRSFDFTLYWFYHYTCLYCVSELQFQVAMDATYTGKDGKSLFASLSPLDHFIQLTLGFIMSG